MSLQDEIDGARREIKTDHYPMSIGEWASMYKDKELDIHPEFQRYYRWSNKQKTNLIESILLGIPIPPIFVSQRSDGVWDVVDGLQRLSTIFQLMGILRDENGKKIPPLELENTKYLPSLSKFHWADKTNDTALSDTLKLLIKRSKLNASIVLMESDKDIKYELFQRLNTGGSTLSDQEVRNCILVMLNQSMYKWLKRLSQYNNFQSSISLSEDQILRQYDMDLALRFVVLYDIKKTETNGIGDINLFLTEKMRSIAQDESYDFDGTETYFMKTFDILQNILDGENLRRYDGFKNKFIGSFLLSSFEVIALGVGYNVKHSTENVTINIIKDVFKNVEYTKWSGSGITATRRLPNLIPLGRKLFSK